MHKQQSWREEINTGILIYANGLSNLYREQIDLGVKIGEKFTALEVLAGRFSRRKNFEIVLVMPEDMKNTGLHNNAIQLGIDTFFFDQGLVNEKPLGLRQQRWAFEDDSGCEEWVGAAFAEPLKTVKWSEFVLLPLENLLVEPAAVIDSLALFNRQNFEICFSKERQTGANWVIFKTEVIKALLANHADIMWARGGLAWAVNKPLYPFEVGNYNCPRIRPSLFADLRMNSSRTREMFKKTIDDAFASPDFSYENYLQKSNWEYFYTDYAPQIIHVEPSTICRAECFSCPKNKLERKTGLMPLQTFSKACSEFEKTSEARFVFSGYGEPLLNPALSDMIALVSSSSSMLITSLQQMPDSNFSFSGLDQLRISVDALEAKGFEQKRPGCNWKNIEQFIGTFSDLKAQQPDKYPELGVTMVRHGLGEKDSLAFLNYWKKVTTPPYQQWFFRWPFSMKPDKIQWYQILGENTFARQLPKTSNIDFTPVKRRPCKHALTSISILWNGDLSACPFDFQGKMILGNIKEQSLMEIWLSDKARAIRQAHLSQNLSELPEICAACTDWYHNL